ncbi:hypothetical protein [Nonomuraea typhae]|uniref:hypothetical protein n=1 Tax=Nonomuraea typhae TaxID=2603600 RepID=UPI0012F9D6C5|nr:hypothetical protein [Nonomuraea typhae]
MRTLCVAAPALLLAYGLIRLIDGLDGVHGPGWAWTAGHLAFLGSSVLFGVLFWHLVRLAVPYGGARRAVAGLGVALGWFGALATTVMAVVDLVAGFAGDRERMGEVIDLVQSVPGVLPAVYQVGPSLLYVGMIVMVAALAPRRVPYWSPVLMAGTAIIPLSLDLIPVAAVCVWLALLPVAYRDADRLRTPR